MQARGHSMLNQPRAERVAASHRTEAGPLSYAQAGANARFAVWEATSSPYNGMVCSPPTRQSRPNFESWN